jgi:tetratricopeptide (TPR) repeat protein
MFELLVLTVFAALAYHAARRSNSELSPVPSKLAERLNRLWVIAHQGMRDNKFLRAEKALLTILKIDQKNAAAYNRLGILYAKQKEYKDAIDCFEIASSIQPSASSLHNLGLIYYETGNYEKAAVAFEQALQLEDDLAARHIAYAKVQEKLGSIKKMLNELERAAELEPNPETYNLLVRAFEANGLPAEAEEIRKKLNTLIMPAGRPRRVFRPRKVVI